MRANREMRARALIILDGLGRHSEKTEALLKRSKCIMIVVKHKLSIAEMKKYNYTMDHSPEHPFDLYRKDKTDVLRISTREHKGNSRANLKELRAELCGLSRTAIEKGEIISIPQSTCETIGEIAKFVLKKWF